MKVSGGYHGSHRTEVQPQIKTSIEEVMDVKIVDFLCDTTVETSRTGAIAVLGLKSKNSLSADWEANSEKIENHPR